MLWLLVRTAAWLAAIRSRLARQDKDMYSTLRGSRPLPGPDPDQSASAALCYKHNTD